MEPVEITTGRLHLRPWLPQDAEQVYAICQDPQIQRWTQVPVPYAHQDARTYVEQVSPRGWETGGEALFAVLAATSGAVLASVGLMHLEPGSRRGELGVWCAAPSRGRGVTTEAAGAVCRWGFQALDLKRIEWLAERGNAASIRVAEKVGFRFEGTARNRLNSRGTQVDAWVGSLVPTDQAVR